MQQAPTVVAERPPEGPARGAVAVSSWVVWSVALAIVALAIVTFWRARSRSLSPEGRDA